MRADRLVAVLLLLQTKGQVTAAEVAAELEVSERTARRDLEALGMAGIPVYSRQGRNGGWQLAGGGRTDLSGLTASEARALFLVAGPASAATRRSTVTRWPSRPSTSSSSQGVGLESWWRPTRPIIAVVRATALAKVNRGSARTGVSVVMVMAPSCAHEPVIP